MRGHPHLFSDVNLEDMTRRRHGEMLHEIDVFTPNYILNASVDDLCDYLESKYRYEVPKLKLSEIYVDGGEAEIDVSQDRNQPTYVKGAFVTFAVPYEGNSDLFRYKPPRYAPISPQASIAGGDELHFRFESTDHDASAIRSEFDHQLQLIQQYLAWSAEGVADFNAKLRDAARQRIELRRGKLLKDQGLTAALGFPIKRHEDAPSTYAAPIYRRKLPIQVPTATTAPYKPEPALEMREYEHILGIIPQYESGSGAQSKGFLYDGGRISSSPLSRGTK